MSPALRRSLSARRTVDCDSFSSAAMVGISSASQASGSITISIFSSFSLMIVLCLHFGQYRGKFFSPVSSRIRVRVLFPHTGHRTQYSFFVLFIRHSPFHIPGTSQITKLTISPVTKENAMTKARYCILPDQCTVTIKLPFSPTLPLCFQTLQHPHRGRQALFQRKRSCRFSSGHVPKSRGRCPRGS